MKPRASGRSAAEFVPPKPTLPRLREAAAGCTGCELYRHATQTVFGEGAAKATLIFIGEQPGDQEDRAGHPFVGPAGRMLDRALAEAGLSRQAVYITNAVKHFKWEPQGKRRKHKRPLASEVKACRPWLEAEVSVIHPKIIVCLGATAAQSVFGRAVPVGKERGKIHHTIEGLATIITVHPSAILRHPDQAQREEEYRRFVADLRLIRSTLRSV
jgi:DNA polymerase